MSINCPNYLHLHKKGELEKRVSGLYRVLQNCHLCPRRCGVNRLEEEIGYCRAGGEPQVSSSHCHLGEEPPISGWAGSGTIFFTHCNLRCVYCQNYPISHIGHGNRISIPRLADIMISLQRRGCHNINLVTPTHFVPQIVAALDIAAGQGLEIPLVYNCGGYEQIDTLRLLEGIIDIYMPDIKYAGEEEAKKYSNAPDYFDVAKEAIKEMHRQVGELVTSENNIALRGLLIRHLILPNNIAQSKKVLTFIKEEISPNTYLSIMNQYFPAYKAVHINQISRRVNRSEYNQVLQMAEELSLSKGWRQS